jgi:hypothetical protein
MMGEAVPMNLVIVGEDVGATDLACCAVMQVDPMSIPHLRLALREGMFPTSLEDIEFNRCPSAFTQRQFRLRRAMINYVHLLAFRNVFINRLFYDSMFADFLHEVLWFIRRNSTIKHILYGKYGTGEANRGGRLL